MITRRELLKGIAGLAIAGSGIEAFAEGVGERTIRIGDLEFDIIKPDDTKTPWAYFDPNDTGTPLIAVPERKLNAKLTNNFTLGELAKVHQPSLIYETGVEVLEHNGKVYSAFMRLDPRLVSELQKLRDSLGEPLIVNSCYRCVVYNSKVGGRKKSRHVSGQAADVKARDIPKLYRLADSQFKNDGVGNYPGFVHVDTRGKRARWTG
jgi:hypothetical protein